MKFFTDFSTFVEIGPITIQWYAVMVLSGAAVAYLIGRYRFKQHGYATSIASDYAYMLLIVGILGCRIWYVIFEWNDIYASQPLEIFAIWHGGLAIQGGLIAGLIFSYFFFKKRNIPFLEMGDLVLPEVLVAQAIGRWGNFFNHEAFGSECTLEFLQSLHLPSFITSNMFINGAYHHPTFLYESIGNLIVFVIIILVVRRFQKHMGTQFFSYFIGYGIVRFFVESLRTDSLMIGPLKTAQVVSVVFIICGIAGIIYLHYKGNIKNESKNEYNQ